MGNLWQVIFLIGRNFEARRAMGRNAVLRLEHFAISSGAALTKRRGVDVMGTMRRTEGEMKFVK